MKQLIKSLLSRFGYTIHKKRSSDFFVGFQPSFLAKICQPETVIDIGVGYGTKALYKAFPGAKFILVEPLTEYKNAIEKVMKNYDYVVYYKAVSDTPGRQEFIVDTKDFETSSLEVRTSLTTTGNLLEKRVVEVTTLDDIFKESTSIKQPILLKVDTEGHELKALQGANTLLQVTDIVIAEVSIAKRFEGSYEFEELILFMKEHGFYLLTFLNITHLDGELRPRFADIVFKRRDNLKNKDLLDG